MSRPRPKTGTISPMLHFAAVALVLATSCKVVKIEIDDSKGSFDWSADAF